MKASLILPAALLPLALAFTSCTSKAEVVPEAAPETTTEQTGDATDTATKSAAADATAGAAATEDAIANVIEGVHPVACGCSKVVTTTTECGNYVDVDGKYFEIEGDLGLGVMEWCHQDGVKAQVKGEVKGDKFMGESIVVVP